MSASSRIKRAALPALAIFAVAATLSAEEQTLQKSRTTGVTTATSAAAAPQTTVSENAATSAGAPGAETKTSLATTPVSGTQAGTPSAGTTAHALVFSAETALRSGLPVLAAEFLSAEANNKNLPNAERDKLLILLAGAHLANNDYAAAATALAEVSSDSAQKRLRQAIVAVAQNRDSDAAKLLAGLEVSAFPQEERAWFLLTRAIAEAADGNAVAAEADFSEAEKNAVSPAVRAHIAFLHNWSLVTNSSADAPAVDLAELRSARDAARGTPDYVNAAKLYIVALAKTGDRAGALAALRAAEPFPKKEIANFALLEGLLADDLSGEPARSAFERVIAERPPRSRQAEAFSGLYYGVSLLRREGKTSEAILAANAIENFLAALKPDDSVRDLELFTRARIALEIGNAHLAQSLSGELISLFPASPYVQDSLRTLISIAVQQKEFRRAVSLLSRLRETEMSPQETVQTDILVADCNFLSGDYRLAADGYEKISQNETLSSEALGIVFFQQAFSHIRNNDVASAAEMLDTRLARRVPAEWTMRTECVVIEALFRAGMLENAAERAKKFLERTDLLTDFRMRILWIQALLAIDLKDAETALRDADAIAALAENLGDDVSPALRETAPELVSRSILLKARARFLADDDVGGLKQLSILRERYPDSAPAVISWLEEGRRFSDLGKPSRALVCYETLLERYGDREEFAEYSAIAAFEAAQAAATVGRPDDAVKQMQKLVSRRPQSPLAFYARMRQADFFRILNDFDSALAIYDNLIATGTDRSELRIVELRRADALRAIAARAETDDSARTTFFDALGKATSAYERLFSLPDQPLSLKAEAGYKWATAVAHSVPATITASNSGTLAGTTAYAAAGTVAAESAETVEARNRAEKQAVEIYWRTATETLAATRERGTAALESSGGYWISRCMFAIAEIYEKHGDYESARNAYKKVSEWSAAGLVPGKRYAEWRLDKILEK